MWLHRVGHGSASYQFFLSGKVSKTLMITLLVGSQKQWVHEAELPLQIHSETPSIRL